MRQAWEACIAKLSKDALMQQVIKLASKRSVDFYDLAVSIWKLYSADTSLMAEIVSETGMRRRRAYYLLDVGKLIDEGELSKKEADAIGWTKLQIVFRHIISIGGEAEAEDLAKFLVIARTTKTRDLAAALVSERKVEPRTLVSFHLSAQEQSNLRSGLLRFGAEEDGFGMKAREMALMRMVKHALKAAP